MMAVKMGSPLAYDPLADTSQLVGSVVFGPNVSRRLGRVLGINLLPPGEAFCTYRCAYCPLSPLVELVGSPEQVPGWLQAAQITGAIMRTLELFEPLRDVDALVLIGNGEPTLHPELRDVMLGASRARDMYAPRAKLAVFTNSSLLANEDVVEALSCADYVVAKLDAVEERLWRAVNRPHKGLLGLMAIISGLKRLRERLSSGVLVVSMTLVELGDGTTNLGDRHLRKAALTFEEIRADEVHLEVPPPIAPVLRPSKEAVVKAAIELSDVVENTYLLTGASTPIPAQLLESIGPTKGSDVARAAAVIPEAAETLLLEGPGARTRLRLLEALSSGKMSCNRLAKELGMSWWSTMGHIERLIRAGLVKAIPFGRRVLYAITPLGTSALTALKSRAGEVPIPTRLL